MTTNLEDVLLCEHIDYALMSFIDHHGPWPVDVNFTYPDGKRNTFKCCLYRYLNDLSLRSDTWDCYEEEPEAI